MKSSILVRKARFWNNLHQVNSKSKYLKTTDINIEYSDQGYDFHFTLSKKIFHLFFNTLEC